MENGDDHRAASCLLPVNYKPAFAYLSLDFSRQDLDRMEIWRSVRPRTPRQGKFILCAEVLNVE